jgi:hypothetical protein
MRIDAVGRPGHFANLGPGQCFFYDLDGHNTFAISSADQDNRSAASVFSKDNGERLPWIAVGGRPAEYRALDPQRDRSARTSKRAV